MHVDIVSAEKEIFSGLVTQLYASGSEGELGILPNHTPLLTILKPGQVRIVLPDGEEGVYYISGGMLEIQPYIVTVLADTAARASDLDEAAALQAKEKAEEVLKGKHQEINYAKAASELALAAAQLRAIQQIRKKHK